MSYDVIDFYEQMLLIRRLEERLLAFFKQQKVGGFLHTCHGHEAVAVGMINALLSSDQIVSYYRGHGHCIAKGFSPHKVIAEIFGKKTGYCQGRGGSLHLMDIDKNVIATSGVVSEALPIAVGAALANKLKKNQKVVVVFFGDGASNNGMFYESLNFASYLQLPVVFVCENNGFATSVKIHETMGNTDIAGKAKALGVASSCIDGTDVEKVYQASLEVVQQVRESMRPFFLECKTVRLMGHTAFDGEGLRYRTQSELEKSRGSCPLNIAKSALLSKGYGQEKIEALNETVEKVLDAAVAFAESSQAPDHDAVYQHLFYGNTQIKHQDINRHKEERQDV